MPANANASTVRSTQARPKTVDPSTVVIVARSNASSDLPLICIATKANQHAPETTMQAQAAITTRSNAHLGRTRCSASASGS